MTQPEQDNNEMPILVGRGEWLAGLEFGLNLARRCLTGGQPIPTLQYDENGGIVGISLKPDDSR